MCREKPRVKCEHKGDLKGCVTKHVTAALKLLDEGKLEKAKAELTSLEAHLKGTE